MTRNIYLAYFLAAMKNSWFWLGIWVLYYLRFTDYAGIGIIESVMIITTSAGEIPTGAVADILGKKKTLIMAFFLEAVGGFIMAFAQNFNQIVLSVFVMCIGGAMYSGTLDALVYDSLKQVNKETKYDKIIANMSSISLFTMALASILGGFLYSHNHSWPFLANALGYSLAFFACLFLIEPAIDTVKFSLKNYLVQTKAGFSQLFQISSKKQVIRLLILGGFLTVLSEMLNSILLVEFGFSDKQMGIIFAFIFLLASFSSQLSPWFKNKLGWSRTISFLTIATILSLIITPIAGLILGGLIVLLLENILPIFNNASSELINQQTESKYRATTISTFNMIKNMPYVLSAFFIGHLMDIMSTRVFAFYFGLVLLLVLLLQKFTLDKKILTR